MILAESTMSELRMTIDGISTLDGILAVAAVAKIVCEDIAVHLPKDCKDIILGPYSLENTPSK